MENKACLTVLLINANSVYYPTTFKGGTKKGLSARRSNVLITRNSSLTHSVAGIRLLEHGILSIDFLKQNIYFQPHGLVAINDNVKVEKITIKDGKMNAINRDWFIENFSTTEKVVNLCRNAINLW